MCVCNEASMCSLAFSQLKRGMPTKRERERARERYGVDWICVCGIKQWTNEWRKKFKFFPFSFSRYKASCNPATRATTEYTENTQKNAFPGINTSFCVCVSEWKLHSIIIFITGTGCAPIQINFSTISLFTWQLGRNRGVNACQHRYNCYVIHVVYTRSFCCAVMRHLLLLLDFNFLRANLRNGQCCVQFY